MAGRVVTLRFVGDDASLRRTLSGLQSETSSAESSIGRLSGSLRNMASGLADVGRRMTVGVTLPIVGAGVAAFDMASDLAESMSKVRVVFGQGADAVVQWSETSAESMGISQQAALEAAGTFGNFLIAMGNAPAAAQSMSTSLVGLASDLASFNNANPAEVLEALRAGLAGEAEPLRRFGVSLSAARIEAEGMAQGIRKSYDEMSAAERSALAYSIILEDTALAQGDFERTADGAANSQRILAASVRDLGAQIGSRLLPVGQRVLDFGMRFIDVLGAMPDGLQNVAIAVGGLAAVAGPLSFALSGVASVLAFLVSPVGLIVAAVAALAAGFVYLYNSNESFRAGVQALAEFLTGTAWPAIQGFVQNLIAGWQEIAPVVQQVVSVVMAAVGEVASFLSQKFGEIVAFTREHWSQIQEAVSHVLNVVAGIVRTAVDVISALWRAWGDDLFRMVQTIWNGIRETIDNALQVVKGIISTVLAVINGDWSRAWEGIKQVVGGVWDQIGNVISTATGLIRDTIGGLASTVQGVWNGLWDGVRDKFVSVWETIESTFNRVVGAIRSAWNGIANFWNSNNSISWGGFDPPGPGPTIPGFEISFPDLPTFAKGVRNFVGGLALVGEDGPELVNLPRGADVFSHGESRQIMRPSSSTTTSTIDRSVNLTIQNLTVNGGDGESMKSALDEAFRELVAEIRSN